MGFDATSGAVLLTWGVFTAFQFHNPTPSDLKYYESNFRRLRVFRIPWPAYIVLFVLTYGPLFVSIFLYHLWLSSFSEVPVTIYILYLVMLMVDKIWFVFFFRYKNMPATIFCALVQVALSATLIILMCTNASRQEVGDLWYVPMILQIPFFLLMAHLVVFSVDWSLQK